MKYRKKSENVFAVQLGQGDYIHFSYNKGNDNSGEYKGTSGDWVVLYETGRIEVMADKYFKKEFEVSK